MHGLGMRRALETQISADPEMPQLDLGLSVDITPRRSGAIAGVGSGQARRTRHVQAHIAVAGLQCRLENWASGTATVGAALQIIEL